MNNVATRFWASVNGLGGRLSNDDEGFQTAEAIAIAAVGIIVLAAILAVLQVLGVDVINWLRDQFGIPSS